MSLELNRPAGSLLRLIALLAVIAVEVIVLILILAILNSLKPQVMVYVASGLCCLFLFTLVTGKGFPHFEHRAKATVFLFFAGIMAFSVSQTIEREERLVKMRDTDQLEYLTELAQVDEKRWQKELAALFPNADAREVVRKQTMHVQPKDVTNTSPERMALKHPASRSDVVPNSCGNGGLELNDIVAVSGKQVVYVSASDDATPLRNDKASQALGQHVDQSIDNSTTVKRLCVQQDWTQISVETPVWLQHVTGWVPSSALREMETRADGSRIFSEADISWDSDTTRYRAEIVAIINKIAAENRQCRDIDPTSVTKSATRSSAEAPVFFATCGSGNNAFNVWFRPTDANAGGSFKEQNPLARNAAVRCKTSDLI